MSEHTPTPWTLDGLYVTNLEPPAIGISIADCGKSFGIDSATKAANAAFILLACNNHTRLARQNEAMRKALESAGNAFEMIRLDLIGNLTEPERSAFWKAVVERDKIRVALALKEPGQ